MEVKALTTFVHGSLSMSRGQAKDVPDAIAGDLMKAGLVAEHKASPEPSNKMSPRPENKAAGKPENKAAKSQNKGRK